VITFAATPSEKGAFEQFSVEPISLGAPVLSRYRHTRSVDDVSFDATRPQPTRQPEAVPTGLEGDSDAFDPMSRPYRFLAPSMQQVQQRALVNGKLLQRQPLDARHDTGD
jgi:hypothetical protein